MKQAQARHTKKASHLCVAGASRATQHSLPLSYLRSAAAEHLHSATPLQARSGLIGFPQLPPGVKPPRHTLPTLTKDATASAASCTLPVTLSLPCATAAACSLRPVLLRRSCSSSKAPDSVCNTETSAAEQQQQQQMDTDSRAGLKVVRNRCTPKKGCQGHGIWRLACAHACCSCTRQWLRTTPSLLLRCCQLSTQPQPLTSTAFCSAVCTASPNSNLSCGSWPAAAAGEAASIAAALLPPSPTCRTQHEVQVDKAAQPLPSAGACTNR